MLSYAHTSSPTHLATVYQKFCLGSFHMPILLLRGQMCSPTHLATVYQKFDIRGSCVLGMH